MKPADDNCLPTVSTSTSDGDHKRRAEREYMERWHSKRVQSFYMDHTRRNMFTELQKDYDRKLSWAESLGIDPLAEGFDPTTPAPPELSSWLYLFHAYLQMEEAYEELMEWLHLKGYRLIDPPPPWKSLREAAEDLWSLCVEFCSRPYAKPGSRASQHKRY